jgi:hypothetical protein
MDTVAMMNLQDIAERLDRPYNTVHAWYVRQVNEFPAPAGRFRNGTGRPYWLTSVIEEWAETYFT